MAVIGTFGSFTAARLGIYASQASLNATGNNIANINTEGYTRQRMDLVSLYSYGGARYANNYQMNVGYGVLVNTVSQLRDPLLDIRFREENASMGAYDEKLDCLQQLANILDEVGRGTDDFGIIEAQLDDFLSQLENLNGKVGSVEYDTTVRGSAQTLAQLFNSYSNAMNTLAANKLKELKEDVKTVNALLTQIRDLNVQIRDAGIIGDQALELRDARNLCIDKLSSYMKIEVRYDEEKIDEFNSVERINISIAGSGTLLIRGVYGAQISMPDTLTRVNPSYNPDPDAGVNNQYVKIDVTDPDNPKLEYTNELPDPPDDGNWFDNNADGLEDALEAAGINDADKLKALREEAKSNFYDSTAEYPYLKEDGSGTFDESEAQIPNALEGRAAENDLLMFVEPLVDAKGRYMRDANHKPLKETITLTDNELYGSLQSLREFLTEKGEFSSQKDPSDPAYDPNATEKRGIQYYQNALDALARKFAESFNKANQLDIGDLARAYKIGEDAAWPGMQVFLDSDNKAILGKDGKPIQITQNMEELAKLKDQVAEEEAKIAAIAEKKDQLAELQAQLGGPDAPEGLQDQITALEGEIGQLESELLTEEEFQTMQGNVAELEAKVEEDMSNAQDYMEILREQGVLTEKWSFYNGGVLFSNNGDSNDTDNITAGNITVSKGWMMGDVRILNTKKADGLNHSTANDNVYHMIQLMSEDMNYYPGEIVDGAMGGMTKKYFTGSFQERLADMNSILGVDMQTTTLLYNEYAVTTLSLENSRQSVAGVDLNDEATNMMVYQKAYAAACQLMTTLDSMLDRLINGTI